VIESMRRPTLVVVSGPPGSGKTTLAHALAAAVPCPAICRDEIKEGMVHAHGGAFEAGPGDPLTRRTLPLFFDVVGRLLAGGVSVVAEAAFQDAVWRSGLEPLAELAQMRIVHCTVDAAVSYERATARRAWRPAHGDGALDVEPAVWAARVTAFERLSIAAPAIDVDTTDGYRPTLSEVVAFVGGGALV
jgi:predicted kinase